MKFMWLFFLVCFGTLFSEDYEVSVYLGQEEGAKYKGVMDYPFHVAFDSNDQMYIVEYDGSALDILDTNGQFRRLGGDGKWAFRVENGPVKDAQFQGLHNIIIDDEDKVYLSDTFNNRCRVYDPKTETISTYIGSGGKGYVDGHATKDSKFKELYNVVFTPDQKEIVIADLKNQRLRLMNRKTGLVKTIAGNGERGKPKDGGDALQSPLVDPRALDVAPDGQIYFADRGGHALRVLRDGKIYTLVNSKGKKGRKLGNGPEAQLFGPKYVGVAPDGRVWIADDQNDRICVYDPKSKQLSSVLGKDSKLSDWEIKRPHGLAFHRDGSIFIVDSGNDRILKMVKKLADKS